MIGLRKVDSFHDNINREGCFDSQDMDGVSKNYRIVFASGLPDGAARVEDCLDEEGTLNEQVEIVDTGDDCLISLKWEQGINANRYITLGDVSSIVVDLGDVNISIVGVFLVDNNTGFVMAYNIQDKGIKINKDQAIFPLEGLLWSIHDGVEQ